MTAAQKNRHLILWGAGTTRTMRPHWVLHELGLDYEMHLIGSRTGETETPEFRALNPRGKIPVLQDGDLTLAESAAIITYLADIRCGNGTGAASALAYACPLRSVVLLRHARRRAP